jgi:2'-5' RNA ligase
MLGGVHKITVQKPNRSRLFLAIPVEHTWQYILAVWQSDAEKELAGSTVPTRWTSPTQYHITVRFIGTIEQRLIPGVVAVLRERISRHHAFSLPFHRIEFATRNEPKMIWARFSKTASYSGLVHDMTRQVVRFLRTRGERMPQRSGYPIIPHITLARAKGNFHAGSVRSGDTIKHDAPLLVRSLVLYESVPHGGHTAFKTIATFPLPPKVGTIEA